MVQEQAICTVVLARFLDLKPNSRHREAAGSLLAAVRLVDDVGEPVLSERERMVLHLMEYKQDKQIALALGLTVYGVRYHMRKLFTKLGVRKRDAAVRRARELGLIPDES